MNQCTLKKRAARIELASLAWKAKVLPLNYARRLSYLIRHFNNHSIIWLKWSKKNYIASLRAWSNFERELIGLGKLLTLCVLSRLKLPIFEDSLYQFS